MNGAGARTKLREAAKAAYGTAKATPHSCSADHTDERKASPPERHAGRAKVASTASAPMTGRQTGNRKYANIQATVNSGSSATNYARRLASKEGRKKDGELFSRMNPLTFARLLLETSMTQELAALETRALGCSTTTNRFPGTSSPSTPRVPPGSTVKIAPPGHVNDMLIGKGTGGNAPVAYDDSPVSASGQIGDEMLPYFLMDARSPEEWKKGHLVGACCYPATMRTKASGPIASKELIVYCNDDDKFIVIYDDDEREAPLLAQSLAERGVTNCYLLSGGLKAIIAKGIQGIYVGELPESCRNLQICRAATNASSSVAASTPRTYSAYGSSGSRIFSGLENTRLYRPSETSRGLRARLPSMIAPLVPQNPKLVPPTVPSRLDVNALRESLNNATSTVSAVSIQRPAV